ncbi:MAG: methionine adenosyltransferase [Ferruginibacter sp.]
MNLNHFVDPNIPSSGDFEIVEKKGRGHPDTLADRLAERLSVAYSIFTKEETGVILRHQFDKLLLMGGRCDVSFGSGTFNSPVRVVFNGRMTRRIGEKEIHFHDQLLKECRLFLEGELRNFKFSTDCRIIYETTSHSTRGLVDSTGRFPINYRFSPRNINDLPESGRPLANDTALGYGFAPYSGLEKLIVEIEHLLTSDNFRNQHMWIGSDIKIMGCRIKNDVEITIAIPQICTEVNSASEYAANIQKLQVIVDRIARQYEGFATKIMINPSDNLSEQIMYLRYTGSCIESGDEGAVARGNRIGGVISACRSYTIEGLNGKNPAYHAGKLYSAVAWEIANEVYKETNIPCEVFVLSQIDRPLDDPWKIIISYAQKIDEAIAVSIVEKMLSNIKDITQKLLLGLYPLC